MAIYRKSSVGFILLVLTLNLCVSMAQGQEKEKAEVNGIQRPLSNVLNPDGTLKVGAGVQGSFNPRGFRMVTGPGGQPRFEPVGFESLTEPADTIMAPGDENWDPQFGSTYPSSNVYAVAVRGTDVYVGGNFAQAGGVAGTRSIAKWDSVAGTWSALAGGVGIIRSM